MDEYGGWMTLHATFHGGATRLLLKSGLGGRLWACKDSRYKIDDVQMISQKEYLEELERLNDK